MKYYYYFRLLLGVLRLSKNPEDTTQVFEISDALNSLGLNQRMLAKLNADPECRRIIESRYRLAPIELDKLIQLPEESFGRAYAEHMIRNKLDPNFFRTREIQNDIDYIVIRNRETHDFWHIVAGFDTSRIGEISVHGLMMAQLESPISSILVSGSLLRAALGSPQALPKIWQGITDGYTIGRGATSLFSTDWEAFFEMPLETVRQKLKTEGESPCRFHSKIV